MLFPKPELYVSDTEPMPPACRKAIELLEEAGCEYGLYKVPTHKGVAVTHGLPSLTGFNGWFVGWQGVRTFVQNAKDLGHLPRLATDIPNRDV